MAESGEGDIDLDKQIDKKNKINPKKKVDPEKNEEESFSEATLNFLRYAANYSPLLILGAVVVGVSYLLNEHAWYHHAIRDLGIAIIVSFIVIITIEQRQRREQDAAIKKFLERSHRGLFEIIFGVNLPRNVWDLLTEKIMNEKFFRKDTHVFYNITIPDGLSPIGNIPAVLVRQETRMEIENLTGSKIKYEARFFVEKRQKDNFQLETENPPSIQLFIDHVEVKNIGKPSESNPGDVDSEYNLYQHNIDIAGKDSRHLIVGDYPRRKLISDTEFWRSIYPCDGLSITLDFPACLTVGLDAIHPDNVEIIHKSDTLIHARISRPLLPHNGFTFWWSPKAPPTPAVPAQQAATMDDFLADEDVQVGIIQGCDWEPERGVIAL